MSLLTLAGRLGRQRLVSSSSAAVYVVDGTRGFAATPASSQPNAPSAQNDEQSALPFGNKRDFVLESFKKMQVQYRQFLKGLKDIDVPMSGDPAKVREFADKTEALKKKIGIPSPFQLLKGEMEYKLRCMHYNARGFVRMVAEEFDLTGFEGVIDDLNAAVDAIEKNTGKTLDEDNPQGWDMLRAKLKEIGKKFGITDVNKVRQDLIYEMYEDQIRKMRQAAQEEIDAVKKKFGMEHIDVDISQLNPKIQ